MCPGHGHSLERPSAVATHPAIPRDWRRRSADIGGLHLATTTASQGQGWMGGDHTVIETLFAELLSDMYTHTNSSVNENSLTGPPPEVPSSVRSRLIHSLDRWNFEPHKLPDEELLECTLILFEALFRVEGMQEAIPVSMKQISAFIHHLRRIYRYENSYHNFEHALDVLQATQSYLKSAGVIPSPRILLQPNTTWKSKKRFDSGPAISCLGPRELFILYVAAIGHDVGHPGFSNIFMKNAKTPLSLVFDNTSALENLHCVLLLQVMKHHGLTVLLDDPQHGHNLRKLLQKSVLATDMGVHKDFMDRMERVVEGESGPLCYRQIIICQAILKNADISNPTRPFLVSKHWANALMQEWTAQAQLEEELQLQSTVKSSDDPMQEANGQIFFISHFAKPLLVLTEKAVPEMHMYTTQCKENLKTWKAIKSDLTKQRESQPRAPRSVPSTPPPPPSASLSISTLPSVPPTSPRQSDPYITAFPLSLPPTRSLPESMYAASASWRSENESMPDSPTESESVSSAMFSSVSDGSNSNKCLSVIAGSVAGSTSGPSVPSTPAPHAAIRAASKVGSLRQLKDARARKASRNSWCLATTYFHSPTPAAIPPLTIDDGPDADTPKKGMALPPASPLGLVHATPPLQPLGGNFMIPRPLNVSVLP